LHLWDIARSGAAMKKPRQSQGLSDKALLKRTGKDRNEWAKILDKAGAEKWNHQEITAFLNKNPKLGPWWGQMLAVSYEQSRGLREKFQKCDGEFAASGSRTLNVPVSKLYKAFSDAKLRDRWIPGADFKITTETANKSIRAKWDGGKSRVSINFYPKGPDKAQVAVDHMKLASSKDSAEKKSYWFDALNRLQEMLES
jgi:hypothetical protein